MDRDERLLSSSDYASIVNFVALSSMDEGIHIVDSSGRTIFYNTAMGSIEGLEPSQVIGRSLREVFVDLTPEQSTLLRVLKTQEPIHDLVQTYNSPNGTMTTVNSTIPITIDGKCVAAMEIAKTISRMRRLSQQVQSVNGSTRARSRQEKRFGDNDTVYSFDDILGDNREFVRVKDVAAKAARHDVPVLLYGETGTGKELFAQGIHNASKRARHRFVAVNCSALPESLIESTLFGNVRGAFTGALDHEGLFEQARGGTLLLDEVNSASPSFQSKLLRVIEEKAIRRVGASRLTPVDVRVIAACNTDPGHAVEKGSLRSDLFFRLSVYTIGIPPLRDRKDDIPLLVGAFSERCAETLGIETETPRFSDQVMDAFAKHSWPGNVRELKNVVESSIGLSPGRQVIEMEDLPDFARQAIPGIASQDDGSATLDSLLKATEARLIQEALEKSHGRVSPAAKALGLTRQSLYYRMAKCGITTPGDE